MRDISSGLLSIHGQHDSQSLTNPALHLGLLDQYAQNRDLFAEYYRRYRELVTVKRQLDALNASESDKQRRIEALTAEIDTIDAAALQPGEEKTLQERKNVITHAQSILAGITAAHLALAGDEDGEQAGAADLLGGAVDGLQNSARLDESLTAMSERLNDLYYSARELATDLADRLDAYALTPGSWTRSKRGLIRSTASSRSSAWRSTSCWHGVRPPLQSWRHSSRRGRRSPS